MSEEIWLAVLGIVSTLVAAAVRYWNGRRGRFKRKLQSNVETAGALSATLETLQRKVGASSVVLLRTQNGGGLPKPGLDIYSSIVMVPGDPALFRSWHRQRIDADYARIILDLLRNDSAVLQTPRLEPGSMLRDVYEARGITHSVVTAVGSSAEAFYYLSCTFKQHSCQNTPANRSAMRATVADLARMLHLQPSG
jgi:type II secretory pathway pseudopilin PulG